MKSFRLKKNVVDKCIYLKIGGSKLIILVLCVIIFFSPVMILLLHEIKQISSKTFEMKDLVKASFVLYRNSQN